MKPKRGQILLLMMGSLMALQAAAEPRFARLYKQQYGYAASCNACHKDGGGSSLNQFGDAFKMAKPSLAAFNQIAQLDSDADGYSNAAEASAKANPGDAHSVPAKPGDWLDTANLIPKEVQALFAGVTAYKPLDAIFTSAEVERAKALGVQLTKSDETTIYIPVAQGKAAGTAIIVPAQFEGQQFFVLLATDRQLNITHAQAMHVGKVKAAADAKLYQAAIGQSAAELQLAGEGLQAAVGLALKKAATILLVRLKKA